MMAKAQNPSDILFNGKNLDGWKIYGTEKWIVEDGLLICESGPDKQYGYLSTNKTYKNFELTIEFKQEANGNSGVFFMDLYEVQVLDSYNSKTYADGMAAAIYGQYPPLVNASRKPGEWQAYDIVFHAPRFDANGGVVSPARLTVFHNGILVQDDEELTGPTAHKARPPYKAHADKLPLSLQDHSHPVRFRNIWIRELK